MYRVVGKRVFDIVFAGLGILLLLPLMITIALLIKMSEPGPVIFSQTRIGKNGAPFRFYKFRSMPVDTGDVPSDKLTDVRISALGKVLRRTNADELPQLFNVLKGDMSIVGPRPPIPEQRELLAYRQKGGSIACRPGLTGLAQVNAFDGMSVADKAKHDNTYAHEISLITDLSIVIKTFGYLMKPPPVY